jgi:ribonuclease HI
VLRWRNAQWWTAVQTIAGSECPGEAVWRHSRPGPHHSWETLLVQVFGVDWGDATANRAAWRNASQNFCVTALRRIEAESPGRFSWFASPVRDDADEIPRRLCDPNLQIVSLRTPACLWMQCAQATSTSAKPLVCCSDSEVLVHSVNGEWKVSDPAIVDVVRTAQDSLANLQRSGQVDPWCLTVPFLRHIPRECNIVADGLANRALDEDVDEFWWHPSSRSWAFCAAALLLHSDGASRGNPGPSSSAAALSVLVDGTWHLAAHGFRRMGHCTSTLAEAHGVHLGLEILIAFLNGVCLID